MEIKNGLPVYDKFDSVKNNFIIRIPKVIPINFLVLQKHLANP
jgi:hypothetical protein